jgi:hypothetical protein
MKVVVDQLVATPKGLVCGTVVHYGDGGPVRFVQAELPFELFTPDVLAALYDALNKALDREPKEESLF